MYLYLVQTLCMLLCSSKQKNSGDNFYYRQITARRSGRQVQRPRGVDDWWEVLKEEGASLLIWSSSGASLTVLEMRRYFF